jgi:ADP-ribose pyrophosphatase YjhB (NUDIX family)
MDTQEIIVANAIVRDTHLLMVQEGKLHCFGQWNIPSGHVAYGENLVKAAIREAKEETGFDVEIQGIICIQNYIQSEIHRIKVLFLSRIVSGIETVDGKEILDLKWFAFDQIKNMKEKLRTPKTIDIVITALQNNELYPLTELHDDL